jgi:serine protease Do
MSLFRSFLFSLTFAASLTFGLSTARADDAKTTTTIPAAPDKAKDKPLPPVFDKVTPDSIDDLKEMEKHVKSLLDKLIRCTVCIEDRHGPGQVSSGSGVIVSEDGIILTAGHVSGEPGREVTIILSDGKRLKGKTLGANDDIDSGMVKITEAGKYPFVEIGKSADMKKGMWCLCIGHPGGHKTGRPPVVRLGRILEAKGTYLRSDCSIVGGDSGGPLFDMQGRVIGINSRIGPSITANIHVPADTFRETWDRLVSSEYWGGSTRPYYGIGLDQIDKDCKIVEVMKDSPAEKAGLKVDDIIKKFDGKDIVDVKELRDLFKKKRPGQNVVFEVLRGKESMKLKLTVGRKEA